MTDRTAAGRDLLASQVLEVADRRILPNQHRETLAALPDRSDGLDGNVGGRGEGKGSVADQTGFDRACAQRFQQRCRGRKLLPLDLVRHILQDAGRLHHGLRISLLIADTQRGLRLRRGNRTQQQARDENIAHHSAATPLTTPRPATSWRVSGISSRPYSIASIRGSKPRIKKWLMPRS